MICSFEKTRLCVHFISVKTKEPENWQMQTDLCIRNYILFLIWLPFALTNFTFNQRPSVDRWNVRNIDGAPSVSRKRQKSKWKYKSGHFRMLSNAISNGVRKHDDVDAEFAMNWRWLKHSIAKLCPTKLFWLSLMSVRFLALNSLSSSFTHPTLFVKWMENSIDTNFPHQHQTLGWWLEKVGSSLILWSQYKIVFAE